MRTHLTMLAGIVLDELGIAVVGSAEKMLQITLDGNVIRILTARLLQEHSDY
jgi:hypothetical protein